ncbi:unnamed protein product [Plutella xylostella]|uniref:(diamondback moth) hypothetical protein n=1 Tax=Plutella xylostella TaxID=51655 RepID=A0A8S4D5Z5_PLUXY|nr:unnamed protein product [Plutella xylostella]
MANEEALQNYSNSIKLIKRQCREAGISEEDFKRMYFESLKDVQNDIATTPGRRRIFTKQRCLFGGIIMLAIIVYNIKTIHSNLQEYIYPGLQVLRRLSIPFISLFPSLTEFYHETCLIHNPYFTVVDMECWPCSTVHHVQQIDDPDEHSRLQNMPFIYKTDQKVVRMNKLKNMYLKNKDILDMESSKIVTNNKYHSTPSEMFDSHESGEKSLFIWKFNTMNTARLIRQIIQRPKVVPKFGQSTERFVIIDNSQQAFTVPDTECNFSFILAVSGSRVVDLRPAEECKHQCKSLRIELKETYLLWYNWWYWKPSIQPSNGNETLIAHVGSYC